MISWMFKKIYFKDFESKSFEGTTMGLKMALNRRPSIPDSDSPFRPLEAK